MSALDAAKLGGKDAEHGSRHSFLWAYVGDRDEVVFDFTVGRGRDGPRTFLGDFRGHLQVDAYAGYDAVLKQNRITPMGCWAHARRRFFKALAGDQDATNAMEVMRRVYRVEREVREQALDADQRRELRQRESKPLLEAMRPWLEGIKSRHLPKSPMGDAINYTLRQWDTLVRYLDDGRLEIDNNRVERQMRSVEPWAYLKDVLQRLAEGEDPAQLTPRLWKAARNPTAAS